MNLLTIKDIADTLTVKPTTVQRWCAQGKLPSYKIGREYRVKQVDFESWLDNKKRGATNTSPPESNHPNLAQNGGVTYDT